MATKSKPRTGKPSKEEIRHLLTMAAAVRLAEQVKALEPHLERSLEMVKRSESAGPVANPAMHKAAQPTLAAAKSIIANLLATAAEMPTPGAMKLLAEKIPGWADNAATMAVLMEGVEGCGIEATAAEYAERVVWGE